MLQSDQQKTLSDLFRLSPTDIYVLERNPRCYDWDLHNVQQLWTDICSLSKGRNDLHLGAIMTSPRGKEEWTEEMKTHNTTHSCRYIDVHDGQQRLVTITLLLCALRDYFLENRSSSNAQVQTSAVVASEEIRGFLAPISEVSTSQGEEDDEQDIVYCTTGRIWQGRSGKYLTSLLLHDGTVPQNGPPPEELATMTYSDRKMQAAHEFFTTEIRNLERFQRIHQLYKRLTRKLKVCDVRFTNSETPRAIILSSHNSKNIEPVDYFRHHLLNATPEGGGTVSRPSKPTLARKGEEELQSDFDQLSLEIGRAYIHEAFVMAAQFELGEPVRFVDGSPAVSLFARYLDSKKAASGLSIFNFLKTVAIKWRNLLEGESVFLQGEDWDEDLRKKAMPSIEFALTLARSRRAVDRRVEKLILRSVLFTVLIPIIHENPSLKKDIPESLKNQEQVFLWVVFGKARPRERQERFSAILADIKRYAKENDEEQWAEILLDKERREVFDALEGQDFGGASYRNPLIKAILYRLNLSLLSRGGSGNTTCRPEMDQVFVESLPTEKDDNSRKLWNQVLSPLSKSPRLGQTPSQKRARIVLDDQLSAYPLTKVMRGLTNDDRRKEFLLEEAKRCWPSSPQPTSSSSEKAPQTGPSPL